MSRRDDQISLVDMLNHAREAVALLGEAGPDDLAGDCWKKRPIAFPSRHVSPIREYPGPRLLECATG